MARPKAGQICGDMVAMSAPVDRTRARLDRIERRFDRHRRYTLHAPRCPAI